MPGRLHRVSEARGARLAVLARLRDGDEADGAISPAFVLERRRERLAHPMRALIIVGDDERDIVAAVGADVRDDDRNLRARGKRENAWRGRAVGGRNRDAGDAARDRVLRVLELGLGAVVRVKRRIGIAGLLRFRLDSVGEIPPERQVEPGREIDDLLRIGGARGRGERHRCRGERRHDGYETSAAEFHFSFLPICRTFRR